MASTAHPCGRFWITLSIYPHTFDENHRVAQGPFEQITVASRSDQVGTNV